MTCECYHDADFGHWITVFCPIHKKAHRCKFCGEPSAVDPSDQIPPADYCHPEDHGAGRFEMIVTLTLDNEVLVEHVCDHPNCGNPATTVVKFSRELGQGYAVCDEHRPYHSRTKEFLQGDDY